MSRSAVCVVRVSVGSRASGCSVRSRGRPQRARGSAHPRAACSHAHPLGAIDGPGSKRWLNVAPPAKRATVRGGATPRLYERSPCESVTRARHVCRIAERCRPRTVPPHAVRNARSGTLERAHQRPSGWASTPAAGAGAHTATASPRDRHGPHERTRSCRARRRRVRPQAEHSRPGRTTSTIVRWRTRRSPALSGAAAVSPARSGAIGDRDRSAECAPRGSGRDPNPAAPGECDALLSRAACA